MISRREVWHAGYDDQAAADDIARHIHHSESFNADTIEKRNLIELQNEYERRTGEPYGEARVVTKSGASAKGWNICVVGAGIGGLSAALALKLRLPAVNIRILEKRAGLTNEEQDLSYLG